MQHQGDTADAVVAGIAARQHGVVSLRQLLAAGMTKSGVARRAKAGRLHRIHRGVYAVGHPRLSYAGRCMAAVLACGKRAVVSHRSAAALWNLLQPESATIEISVPGTGGKGKHAGIKIHRSRTLTDALVTRRNGIPVTRPARTVSDLRRVLSAADLRRTIRQADVFGFRIDESDGQSDGTRSELEHLFLRLCRRHGLVMPEVNVQIDSFLVDFLWNERRLIVETDGYRFHSGREAFEDDRERDLRLKSLGYEVVRLTYRQVASESDQTAEMLRRLLTR